MDPDPTSAADPSPGAAKHAARVRGRARRSAMAEAERASASARIGAHLVALADARGAETIGVYAAVGAEVDPGPAVVVWLSSGIRVAYPAVTGPGAMTLRVSATVLGGVHHGAGGAGPRDGAVGVAGRYGVPEPPPDAPAVDAVDLLVVPGVAFDPTGGRLGQGAGFYDRFLDRPDRPFAVGVCFSVQVVDAVPQGAHDQRMDAVLTEDAVYRFPDAHV